jgi:hypothetical protein
MIAGILITSCKDTAKNDTAVLAGSVYFYDENSVLQPVSGALINSRTYFAQAKTNAQGYFELTLEPTEEEFELELQASKVGFYVDKVTVLAKKGEVVNVPDILLTALVTDTSSSPIDTVSSSGPAAHIEVLGKHLTHIYIQSSGLKETALINFIVTDARGIAVDKNHQCTVNFSILNGPDGGEYLYPESMGTQNGSAYTVLNSGAIAGPVQILASVEVDGKTLRSQPIRIAIYGGLPDNEHFSLALERVNIAGRVHFGIIDYVTAFVGDKFSNPVAPGTSVYFNTDYGMIEGAAVTDELGRAMVRYLSAAPLPPYPAISSLAHIQAFTYNDTLQSDKISTGAYLLLTDMTAPIDVYPTQFTYKESNTAVKFDFTVSDIWGYPIVGESKIEVTATDGKLAGDISMKTLDTQAKGPGFTEFQFTWASGDSLDTPEVYIMITVSTPPEGNGYRSVSIQGTKIK